MEDITIAGFRPDGMVPAGTFVIMALGFGADGGAVRQVGAGGITAAAHALIITVTIITVTGINADRDLSSTDPTA